MHFEYKTERVCASRICFDIEDNIVRNVSFTGGCDGNLKAISKLVEGRSVDEIIETLSGNECRERGTSCADQLARALSNAMLEQAGDV